LKGKTAGGFSRAEASQNPAKTPIFDGCPKIVLSRHLLKHLLPSGAVTIRGRLSGHRCIFDILEELTHSVAIGREVFRECANHL
jgi:hypothetical protein